MDDDDELWSGVEWNFSRSEEEEDESVGILSTTFCCSCLWFGLCFWEVGNRKERVSSMASACLVVGLTCDVTLLM